MTTRYALMILLAALAQSAVCEELPDPDGKPAAHVKPVKVFILLGQSNMLGFAEIQGQRLKAVGARPFWRGKSVSPSGQGYHYNHNAETYMEVGNALGWAMAELQTGKK